MFKIIATILIAGLVGFCTPRAQATQFSDLMFGQYQFSDTQWNVSACLYTSTCQVYSLSGIGTTWNTGSPVHIGSTQYIGFVASGNSSYPWDMILYNSNGTQAQNLGIGKLDVQGSDTSGHYFFFFTNANLNGTVFSLNYGFPNTNGFSFTGTAMPTTTQTNQMASADGSTSTVAQGQTVSGGGSTPTYSSSITSTEQTLMTQDKGYVTNLNSSQILIDQIGSNDHVTVVQNTKYDSVGGYTQTAMPIRGGNNTVVIHQGDPSNTSSTHNMMQVDVFGGGGNTLNLNQGTDTNGNGNGSDTGYHFLGLQINGSSNSVTTQQQNTGTTQPGVGNYTQISIQGNANNVGVYQTGSAPQQSFNAVTGNSNTLSVTQSGSSTHFSDVTLTGNGNSATINQSNTGATGSNAATIVLNNAGGATNLNLTQTGGQTYSINQTCTSAAGCGTITVKQGN